MKTKYFTTVILWLIISINYYTAAAHVIRVDRSSTAVSPNGSSWAQAYSNLQTAINDATAGDTLWVAQGTYRPATQGQPFVMKEGVKIFGGFASGATSFADRNLTLYKDTLRGNYYSVVANINNGLTTNAVLDGFVIVDGLNFLGAGMYNVNASPLVRNCTFARDSSLLGGGGAMYNANSSPHIISCVFFENYAHENGGAIYNDNESNNDVAPFISNSAFIGNYAWSYAGAIYNANGGSTVISNCLFSENEAAFEGGAILNAQSRMEINNSNFIRNVASSNGGAIANVVFANLTLDKCIFSGNNALDNGGALANLGFSRTNINKCRFSGNSSDSLGGAMLNFFAVTEINNSLFSGNKAERNGGALFDRSGTFEIYNSTFAGNNAGESGGGILNDLTTSINIGNSIIYGNSSGVNFSANNDFSITHSLVQGINTVTNGNISGSVNPMFVNPQSHATAPNTQGNYSLLACSRAINAGHSSNIPPGSATDLADNPRVYGHGAVDLGAYEFQGDVYPIDDTLTVSLCSDTVYILPYNNRPYLRGIYIYDTLKYASGCDSAYLILNLKQATLPVITINQPNAVCAPQAVALANSIVDYDSNNIYTYFDPNGVQITGASPLAATSGNYKIVVTNEAGCIDSAFVNVVINPKPTVITHNPAAQCAPGTADLTLPGVTVGSTIGLVFSYWLNESASSPVPDETAVTHNGSKLYYLVGETAEGCTDTTNVLVVFYAKPNVVAFNPPQICPGNFANLKFPYITYGSTPNLSYSYWDSNNNNITATANAVGVGTYHLVGQNTAGCRDTATLTVSINPSCYQTFGDTPGVSGLEQNENGFYGSRVAVKLYPNPTNEVIYFEYEALQSGTLQSWISDVSGRILSKQNYNTATIGIQRLSVNVSALPAGIYYFNFSLPENKEISAIKFIVGK